MGYLLGHMINPLIIAIGAGSQFIRALDTLSKRIAFAIIVSVLVAVFFYLFDRHMTVPDKVRGTIFGAAAALIWSGIFAALKRALRR